MKVRLKGRARFSVWIGAVIVALVILAALLSLAWTPFDPVVANPAIRLQPPNTTHWFGTDRLGRDVLSQIMAGSRVALKVGALVVFIGALIGIPLGLIAAIKGGVLGAALGRGFDLMMAIPGLLLAIIFAASFGASTTAAAVALGIAAIPAFARITRAGALSVLESEYVTAAKAFGAGQKHIAIKHVLPNIAGSLIVHASVAFGLAILAEAGLSYLGLGTPPPTPSWGRMLQDSQSFLDTHLNLILAPGLATGLAVLGFNLLGDGLRDALDPKLRYRR
jgi:peptide/nickel transport system permease protein